MGKASRIKAEKRKAPPPVGKQQGVSQRTILYVTIGVIVVIVAGAIGYSQLKSSPKAPPPAAASAADKGAPASLVTAAAAIGFKPQTEAGRRPDREPARLRRAGPVEPEPPPRRLDGARLHAEDSGRADASASPTTAARRRCSSSSRPGARTATRRRPT